MYWTAQVIERDAQYDADTDEIVYEWYESRKRVAVIAVSRTHISWSGIIDGAMYTGKADLPDGASQLLNQLLDRGDKTENSK